MSAGEVNDNELFEEGDLYRDKIATVDDRGKRIWLYPKKPKGRFYDYRKWLSYVLLALLFGLPFIKINGEPFMLFNIIEGNFRLFGIYFSPQDFHIFVIGMLISILFITLFTVVFGRIFCGWICPQTIFMEMVFRRIEYWIEGDANAQRRLNKAPWTSQKAIKKIAKHAIFLILSFAIAHTFLAYIIGIDEVYKIVTDPVELHWRGLVAMIIFTIVFYAVFAQLREQVCTTICPYGRLQGVLLDENSLAVAYDFVRGEPRGKLKKKKKIARKSDANEAILKEMFDTTEEEKKGDCIDCGLCVQVCPTGIDIRNGTQLECVNCTACMDACDEVMVKIKKPEGLIRIDSYNGIKSGVRKLWNTRIAAYTAVLIALFGLEAFLLVNRSDVETLFLRTPGMLFQDNKDGYISNLYNYQLINKTDKIMPITFVAEGLDSVFFQPIGEPPTTIANSTAEGAIFVKIPKNLLESRKTNLKIKVMSGDEIIDYAETTFFGPIK